MTLKPISDSKPQARSFQVRAPLHLTPVHYTMDPLIKLRSELKDGVTRDTERMA